MSGAPAIGPIERGPGHEAALAARGALEEALFAMPDIPVDFDRGDLRDRLLRAVQCCYAALDNPVVATAHIAALGEAASMAAECRALLSRVGDAASIAPLGRAVERLGSAEAALRKGGEAVAQIQLARRSELCGGVPIGAPPPPRPFRAGLGEPALHAPPRQPLLPLVIVDPKEPIAEPPAPPVTLPRPKDFAALAALAEDAASGALEKRMLDPDEPPAVAPEPELPPAYEPAIEEVEVLRRLGRDCLEDIAVHRNLRKPNAIEGWLDQAPFEQRLINNLDAFAALGGPALPVVALYNAEAKIADPERAFAVALMLGSIEGTDTVGAAVMTLKQSPPETFPGWIEGFSLAPSPAVDPAMADLATSSRADLAAVALDVLWMRGATPDGVIRALLDRPEPSIAQRVERALAVVLPREEALPRLEATIETTPDPDRFFTAMESLLQRGFGPALVRLRDAADDTASPDRALRALELLGLVGRPADVDRLFAAARSAPTPALVRALGRFGHVHALPLLVDLLASDDEDIVAAAAEALDRLTNAGLRAVVEEPWDIELPPEAALGGGTPVPLRRVERVVTDPEPWSAWIRERAGKLDPKVKTRGGAPFHPAQIVAELGAATTPPDRRGEALRELLVLTGVRTQFSPDDWVARQKRHLDALRADVATISFAPGSWSFAGASGFDDARSRPAPRPASAASSPSRAAFAPAPPLPSAPAIPALRDMPAAPVPPAPVAPPPVVPAVAAPPVRRLDATIASPEISPFAALPFEAASAAPPTLPRTAPLPVMRTPSAESPDEITGLPTASPFAVLPFKPGEAPPSIAAPSPAAPVKIAPKRPDLGATTVGAISPFASRSVLPFQTARPPSDPAASTPVTNVPAASTPVTSVPAASTPVTSVPAASTPVTSVPAASAPAAAPPHDLTMAQYASLCAEVAASPADAEATFARYGLASPADRQAVDQRWRERLAADPEQHRAWQRLYRRHTALIEERKKRG
ncbi:MAG: hypothetical protein U0359_36325 [Byssovorax sp.]